jgi:hypothetical protein
MVGGKALLDGSLDREVARGQERRLAALVKNLPPELKRNLPHETP